MVVAIAPWSLVVHPGKKISYDVIRDFKVTNAALGAKLEDEKARSTLKVVYEPPSPMSDSDEEGESPKGKSTKKTPQKAEVSLCSLTPGSIEQASLDITFLEDDSVEFEVIGKNSIHLFGNYVDQSPLPTDFPPDDLSDEESVDLRDVSSDVEVNPDELEGLNDSDDADRFEEIDEDVPAGKKRPRDSDAMDDDEPMKLPDSAKKVNKKLKAENGSAVPTSPVEGSAADAKPDSKKGKKEKTKERKTKENSKSDAEKPASDAEGIAPEDNKSSKPSFRELSGGLKLKDFKVGTGKQAKTGQTVSMRYIGKFPGGKVFDSNTKGKPFTFRIGSGEVIKGWDQGVVGMQVGGERLLIVPPALGYGKKGTSGIPANSTLHFELKLVNVK